MGGALNPSHMLMIIPDGVSLRNFIYSPFLERCKEADLKVSILNLSGFIFELDDLDVHTLKESGQHFLTSILKNVRKQFELRKFEEVSNNPIYKRYLFKAQVKDVKTLVRLILTKVFYLWFSIFGTVVGLRRMINYLERQTPYYKACEDLLQSLKPDIVYNCSQRAVSAIAPIQAAKHLGIPTVGFIYSWDNLPKATLDVESDYYHVWSAHMKAELLKYHPFIKPDQITVTGTPQFEMHFDVSLKQDRGAFLSQYGLDAGKKYICFSGDDVTTSPHDPQYLEDVAQTVRTLNLKQDQWRIIFRRCPVDFSNRYEAVLNNYQEEITPISPQWQRIKSTWDAVLPLTEDNALLLNTVAHCELVINLGSSMVFDAACHGTPCAYIAYNPEDVAVQKDVHTIYQYIHFHSMPNEAPVFWLKKASELSDILTNLDLQKQSMLLGAQAWFHIINEYPTQNASGRICKDLVNVIN